MKNPLALGIKSKGLSKAVDALTCLDQLRTIYDQWLAVPRAVDKDNGPAFLDFVLSALDVSLDLKNNENLACVPTTGPLIIVANHPLGGLEGMLLTQLLLTIRPDVKVLANEVLLRFPEFSELFIGVDVLSDNKTQENSRGIRALSRHLSNQGALLIFPAGTVSVLNPKNFVIEDAPWHSIVGKLALKYQAACLPIYVADKNNQGFYLTGLINKRLRTALLARVMVGKSDSKITAHIGETITAKETAQFDSAGQLRDYLRICTHMQGQSDITQVQQQQINQQIRTRIDKTLMVKQLATLNDFCLLDQGVFRVYCAPYNKLGCVMEQLARVFLADTLLQNFSAGESLRQSVKPASPLAVESKPWSAKVVSEFGEIPIINKLLGRIDSGKRIPVLIRHYLALNGRFISFTVNKQFNHSLAWPDHYFHSSSSLDTDLIIDY